MKRLLQKIFAWELWPFYIIYTPLGFVWLWYAIKAKAFWFFSPVNPTLEFAGFEGESKKEMYDQLPAEYFPATFYISPDKKPNEILYSIYALGFSYPFIVKPEIGMQGLMFRIIENEKQLLAYHQYMPYNYMVQQFVDLPLEFSVFYVRYPGKRKGSVTGFILKDYLAVTGDGKSTLLELIKHDKRAKHREHEMKQKHAANLYNIIKAREKYYLSLAGNHNRGARFINCKKEIDENLSRVFDEISLRSGSFFYGRFDIKCSSIENLKRGKDVMVLEFNGAGSEPNHIYDCGMKYFTALKEIAQHWKHMFAIGHINSKKGVAYWNFSKGFVYLQKAKTYFKKLKHFDEHFEMNIPSLENTIASSPEFKKENVLELHFAEEL